MTQTDRDPTSPPTETENTHPSAKTYTPRLEEFEEALAYARKRYEELPYWLKGSMKRSRQSIPEGDSPKSKRTETLHSRSTETQSTHPSVKTYTPRLEEFEEAVASARKQYKELPDWLKATMERRRRSN